MFSFNRQRKHHSVVFTKVRHLPELVFSLLIKILEIYSDTLKEDIFLYQKM